MVGAPVLHVNGDDPEAVVFCAELAFDFRQPLRPGRGHRPGLLPPPRPQRGRRAGGDAAADVPEHPRAQDARASCTPQRLRRGRRDRPPTRRRRWSTATAASSTTAQSPPNWSRSSRTSSPSTGRSTCRASCSDPVDTALRPQEARQAGRRRINDVPADAQAASARGQDLRGPPQDGGRRAPRRLGLRREPRLRDAAGRRLQAAPGRPGLRPRHVLPPPRDPARPDHRRVLPAAARAGEEPGRRHHHRLAAQRGSGDGASSTATPPPIPTRWTSGKRSSATSPTARRS